MNMMTHTQAYIYIYTVHIYYIYIYIQYTYLYTIYNTYLYTICILYKYILYVNYIYIYIYIWLWLKKRVWIVPRVIRTYGSVWITCVLVWIMGYGSHVVPGYESEPYILSRSHIYFMYTIYIQYI